MKIIFEPGRNPVTITSAAEAGVPNNTIWAFALVRGIGQVEREDLGLVRYLGKIKQLGKEADYRENFQEEAAMTDNLSERVVELERKVNRLEIGMPIFLIALILITAIGRLF